MRVRTVHLPSASWRSSNTSSVIHKFWSWSIKPRARSADVSATKKLSFCLFCSIQTSKGLDDTYLHWWGSSSFLIQMAPSRNDLKGTSRNTVLLAIWASLRPVKLTHKINHHKESRLNQIYEGIVVGMKKFEYQINNVLEWITEFNLFYFCQHEVVGEPEFGSRCLLWVMNWGVNHLPKPATFSPIKTRGVMHKY